MAQIRGVFGTAITVAALGAVLSAQQLSPSEAATVKKEVTATVETYYRLFTERKPDALAEQVFNTPWLLLGASGPTADLTAQASAARFGASMKQLVESGWAKSVFTTENVCVLNANAALVSGYNTRYKTDGGVMSVGGVTYILGKSKDGWRIVSYSGHARGKVVRCDD